MTTAPARTRKPVTQILVSGTSFNRTATYRILIWSDDDWIVYTFNNSDPAAFAQESRAMVVRTVTTDELGNMVSVTIGTGENAKSYAITKA